MSPFTFTGLESLLDPGALLATGVSWCPRTTRPYLPVTGQVEVSADGDKLSALRGSV